MALFKKLTSIKSHPERESHKILRSMGSCFSSSPCCVVKSQVCLIGISKTRPFPVHLMVALSLQSRSLPKRDRGDWGQTVNVCFSEKQLISTLMYFVNARGITFPPTPIMLSLAMSAMDPLRGGLLMSDGGSCVK